MKIEYSEVISRALSSVPLEVQKAFWKQVEFLRADFHHPSLHAKKYGGVSDLWQARVNNKWRFYFRVIGDTYRILDVVKHPK